MQMSPGVPNSGLSFAGSCGEHVERGAGDMAAVERVLQRRFVDQPAARAIDDAHAVLGLGQRLAREDPASLVGERRVQA